MINWMQDLCWLLLRAKGGNLGAVVRKKNSEPMLGQITEIYKDIYAQSYRRTHEDGTNNTA